MFGVRSVSFDKKKEKLEMKNMVEGIDELQKLICEELNISQNVLDAAQSIIGDIILDANDVPEIPAGEIYVEDFHEYTVTLLGNEYTVYCRFIHFRNVNEWKAFRKEKKKQNSGFNATKMFVRMTVDVINDWFDETSVWRDLYHELSHLHFHLRKGDYGDNAIGNKTIYNIAKANFTYKDDNNSKAAQAVYLRGTNEMSAFVHGLYGEISKNDEYKTHLSANDVMKKSPVYIVYCNLRQFEDDILNGKVQNLDNIASKYGITSREMYSIVKNSKSRLGAGIARAIAKASGEKEINEMINSYSDYIRASIED